MKKNKRDIDTDTVLTYAEEEKRVADITRLKQEERDRLIAQTHQMIGQIKAADAFGKFANISSLVWFKQVKDSKIYRDLPDVGTWENFCNSTGLSRQKIDMDLLNLSFFGEEFLITVNSLSVGYRELRMLRQLSNDGAVSMDGDAIVICGERILLSPEHKEDLQAAIERIIEEKVEAQAVVKAKDRVLSSKDEVINKQARELVKLENVAASRGLTLSEDALHRQMETLRTSFEGYMLKTDPEHIMGSFREPGEITPRMRADLISTLQYMKMQILAAYDAAVMNYGDPNMNPEVLENFEEWEKSQG